MFYPDGSIADCTGYNYRARFGKRVYPFTAWRFNHQPLYVILSGIEEKARPQGNGNNRSKNKIIKNTQTAENRNHTLYSFLVFRVKSARCILPLIPFAKKVCSKSLLSIVFRYPNSICFLGLEKSWEERALVKLINAVGYSFGCNAI